MAKETTLSVVSSTEEKKEKSLKKAAELTKELIAFKEKIEKRGYIVEGGSKTGETVLEWLMNNASWKFTEAMGVMEAVKQVEKGLADIKSGKSKEMLLNNLALEAIYYFVSKQEGKGLADATNYYENLLKPVADALGRAKVDKDAVKDYEYKIASAENGLETDEISEAK